MKFRKVITIILCVCLLSSCGNNVNDSSDDIEMAKSFYEQALKYAENEQYSMAVTDLKVVEDKGGYKDSATLLETYKKKLSEASTEKTNDASAQQSTKNENVKQATRATLPTTSTVIYDDNGIKISVSNFKSRQFKFEVENNNGAEIVFTLDCVLINDCIVYDSGLYQQRITSGNKAIDSFDFSAMEDYGLTTIETFDICASFYFTEDFDKYKAYKSVDCYVELLPSSAETVVSLPEIKGKLCYENDAVEVYLENRDSNLNNFYYYIHNKTDKTIELDVTSCAVNGIMAQNYSCWGWATVYPNGYYYTGASNSHAISIWSALGDEIKEKGFDKVNKIEVTMRLYPDVDNGGKSQTLENICLYNINK